MCTDKLFLFAISHKKKVIFDFIVPLISEQYCQVTKITPEYKSKSCQETCQSSSSCQSQSYDVR